MQFGGTHAASWGYNAVNHLVLSKIKQGLGLDKCKYAITAAAPIRPDTLEFFASLGISINEVQLESYN